MNDVDFIAKQKLLYGGLQPIYCPSIKETAHFTSDGLNHLLYNRRRPRNLKAKRYRAALISYIEEVIKDATTATKKVDIKFSKDPLWVLEHEVKARYKGKKQIVKVILQKKGAGKMQFLSVMSKKL